MDPPLCAQIVAAWDLVSAAARWISKLSSIFRQVLDLAVNGRQEVLKRSINRGNLLYFTANTRQACQEDLSKGLDLLFGSASVIGLGYRLLQFFHPFIGGSAKGL